MKINLRQFSSPQEFQAFVSKLLYAEYGDDFHALDGWTRDDGVDGYLGNFETVFQCKYPITGKFRKRSVVDSFRKALNAHGATMRWWRLISPSEPTKNLAESITTMGQDAGIECGVYGESWILTRLAKHRHIALQTFGPDVQEILDRIDVDVMPTLKDIQREVKAKRPKKVKVVIPLPPDAISEQEAALVRSKIEAVAQEHGGDYAAAWSSFYNKFGIDRGMYKHIRKCQLPEVLAWLDHCINYRTRVATPHARDASMLRGIKSIARQLGLSESHEEQFYTRWVGVAHVTKMTLEEKEIVLRNMNALAGGRIQF